MERLVQSHLRLVTKIARGFSGYGLPVADIDEVAIRAVEVQLSEGGSEVLTQVCDTSLEADFSTSIGKSASVLRPAGSATKAAAPLVSPVLRDDTGRARALPGGVLVVMKHPVDEVAARALIARAGAVPVRRVAETIWLLEGPTGLGSLELAERLHETGVFASAQPNWWIERSLK
jgi:hypothetical protein